MKRYIKKLPRDGVSRGENLRSQPHVEQAVFNNHKVLTQGWYPVCAAKKLKVKQVRSFKIGHQRVVVFRTEQDQLCAMDAFCPHLGADLGNGAVIGENLRCYFHNWELNQQGQVAKIPCKPQLEQGFQKVKNRTYPVIEAYGHIWIFSAPEATHDLPRPAGLEHRELTAYWVKEVNLFAHHHVMMANGIDLQHFSAVHGLDIAFDYDVNDNNAGVSEWTLRGEIPEDTFKGKLARFLVGPNYQYHVKFAGGTITTITYGADQYFMGIKLPTLQILWGALPLPEGVSNVRVFFVSPKYRGFFGPFKILFTYLFTLLMLTMLRDEDVYAFPNMRFNAHQLIKEDRAVGQLIQWTNQLPLSDWGEN